MLNWLTTLGAMVESMPIAIWIVLPPALVLALRARRGRIVSRLGQWLQPAWLGLLSWIVGRDANTLSPGVAFAAGGALVAGIAAGFLLAFPARVGADHQWGLLRIGGSVLPLAAVLATFAATLVVHAGIGAPRVLMASLVAMAFAVGLVTGRVLGHDLKARRTEHVDLMAPGKTGRFLSRL